MAGSCRVERGARSEELRVSQCVHVVAISREKLFALQVEPSWRKRNHYYCCCCCDDDYQV